MIMIIKKKEKEKNFIMRTRIIFKYDLGNFSSSVILLNIKGRAFGNTFWIYQYGINI